MSFKFSGENNWTPDQCWVAYAVDSYKNRRYTDEEIENEYSDYFANSPHTENIITDALKSCSEKVKIRKAQVYLKKFLSQSKDPLTQSHVMAFGPNTVQYLKKYNINLTIKK